MTRKKNPNAKGLKGPNKKIFVGGRSRLPTYIFIFRKKYKPYNKGEIPNKKMEEIVMLRQLKGTDEKKFYLEEVQGFVYELNPNGGLKQVYFGSIRIKRSTKNNGIKMIYYSVSNSTYQLGEEGVVCEHSGTYRFWVKNKNQVKDIYSEFMIERLKRLEERVSIIKKNMANTIL